MTEWGGGTAAKAAKIPCPHCGKMCRGKPGVYSHIKAKHGGKGKGAFKVQAEIDRASGMPGDDDWLLP